MHKINKHENLKKITKKNYFSYKKYFSCTIKEI